MFHQSTPWRALRVNEENRPRSTEAGNSKQRQAAGQVVNVNLQKKITPQKLRAAINGNVGKDVRVFEAEVVDDDFHARYSAVGKTYLYRVVNGPVISPFWLRYAHHDARPLDLEN